MKINAYLSAFTLAVSLTTATNVLADKANDTVMYYDFTKKECVDMSYYDAPTRYGYNAYMPEGLSNLSNFGYAKGLAMEQTTPDGLSVRMYAKNKYTVYLHEGTKEYDEYKQQVSLFREKYGFKYSRYNQEIYPEYVTEGIDIVVVTSKSEGLFSKKWVPVKMECFHAPPPAELIEAVNSVDNETKKQEESLKSAYAHFKNPIFIELTKNNAANSIAWHSVEDKRRNTKKQLRLFYNWKLCYETVQSGYIRNDDVIHYSDMADGLMRYHSSNAMSYQDSLGNIKQVEFRAWIHNAHEFTLSQNDVKKLSIILSYKQGDSADYMQKALNIYNWIKYNTDRQENSINHDFWITWLKESLNNYVSNKNIIIFKNKLHAKLFEAIAQNDRSAFDKLINTVTDDFISIIDDRIIILKPENMTSYNKEEIPSYVVYDFSNLPSPFNINNKNNILKPTANISNVNSCGDNCFVEACVSMGTLKACGTNIAKYEKPVRAFIATIDELTAVSYTSFCGAVIDSVEDASKLSFYEKGAKFKKQDCSKAIKTVNNAIKGLQSNPVKQYVGPPR